MGIQTLLVWETQHLFHFDPTLLNTTPPDPESNSFRVLKTFYVVTPTYVYTERETSGKMKIFTGTLFSLVFLYLACVYEF